MENPQAPASMASMTSRRICATSSGVAARLAASPRSTNVRTLEWPTKQATFGPTPFFSSMLDVFGK